VKLHTNPVLSSFLKIDTRDFAVHLIDENNTTRSSAHENDGQMILFCVTKCLGSFKVATKKFAAGFPKLQANAIYCRQTLFISGKRYLLQANVFLKAQINCRQAWRAR
jgi:hypothetical protein